MVILMILTGVCATALLISGSLLLLKASGLMHRTYEEEEG